MRSQTGRVLSFSALSLLALEAAAHASSPGNHAAIHKARAEHFARDDSPAFTDPVTLTPPAIPSPAPPTEFDIALPASPAGLSIPHSGAFIGFSVEFSVSSQVLGKKVGYPAAPFVNLMRNLAQRAGRVIVRVGGNSQEDAQLVTNLGTALVRASSDDDDGASTPTVQYTRGIIELMATISRVVDIGWILGIPFGKDTNFDLKIAEVGQEVLGDKLIGLQGANQPDYYGRHGRRKSDWSPYDFFGEFGVLVDKMTANTAIKNPNILLGPSITLAEWVPEQIWDTGFIGAYAKNLFGLAIERYPASNCAEVKGIGKKVEPQELMERLLRHGSVQEYVQPYLNSSALALAAGKPFLNLEYNTGTCSGFPGFSDSFGAALWALDNGMQMAYANFTAALLHVGGKNAYYNPFTPPPYAESDYHQWTIGSVYYSALVMSEVLGSSSKSQVLDLGANGGNEYTPGYAIYEDGAASRVALFNYVDDASGKSDYTARIAAPAGASSVKVKYLTSDSVVSKSGHTWANQTLGNTYEANGLLSGTEVVQTVACADGVCPVKVPAPSFALVFLTDKALADSAPKGTGAASVAGSAAGSATSSGKGAKATGKDQSAAAASAGQALRMNIGAVVGAVLLVACLL